MKISELKDRLYSLEMEIKTTPAYIKILNNYLTMTIDEEIKKQYKEELEQCEYDLNKAKNDYNELLETYKDKLHGYKNNFWRITYKN